MEEGIHITLKAETLTQVFGVPITNTMLMSWLVMIVLIALSVYVGKHLTKIPSRLQTSFETVFSFLLDYVEEVLESRTLALRFFPLLVTLFLFILLGNWFGLLPGVGSLYLHQEVQAGTHVYVDPAYAGPAGEHAPAAHTETISLFHPVSTDLNVTLALALISFMVIEMSGVLFVGFAKYFSRFFNVRSVMGFFIGIIELISELVRLLTFSFRLFGNMFAGKTLILVAMFFVPYLVPVPLMAYEVIVGFIQASIFALLTLFFIKLAISEVH